MARIVEDNKVILKKLQTASSFYNHEKWVLDERRKNQLVKMICKNSDRFCKNPYFLHSLATSASDTGFSFYNPSAFGQCKF